MKVRAIGRAKVNLYLGILGDREDGYSEVSTVMQSIDWHDTLTMERSAKTEVSFSPAGYADVVERPDLVERAIGLFNQTTGGTQGADVTIAKTIPVGSGLGGGSADAAAALRGMSALTAGPADESMLLEIAAQLGSDVPFALLGGSAIARGRGEVLEGVAAPKISWVVGAPGFSLSTREIYSRSRDLSVTSDDAAADVSNALTAGDLDALSRLLHNDLEMAAFDVRPELEVLKQAMIEAGALAAVMSGSGSSIAGLCRDPEHARQVSAEAGPSFPGGVRVCSSAAVGAEPLG